MHHAAMIQKLFNNKNQTGLLALAPLFLVVASFNDGITIGLISLVMILILTSILYFISNFIPLHQRLISVLVVSVAVTLVARMLLNSEIYFVADKIGLFLPLLVINSLVISLGEEVFSKQDYKSTMIYVSGSAIAVLIFFIIFGSLKGWLDMFSIIDSPAGSFILLGLLFATINFLKSTKATE
ncbi:MAG: electron transport complex protein RnfE [Gammaproteobacteria bacterium]|jgi:electron transport complex protein RnfE